MVEDHRPATQGIRITTCHADGANLMNLLPGHFPRSFRGAYNGNPSEKRVGSLGLMCRSRIRDESSPLFQLAERLGFDPISPSIPVSVSLGKV